MADRESRFDSLRLSLRDPLRDIAFAPHAALREFADGLGKAARTRKLVGSLLGHAEHLPDLRGSDKFHLCAEYLLTASRVKRYYILDSVKRPRVALTTGAAT